MPDPVNAALPDHSPSDSRIPATLLEAFCAGDDVARSELPIRYEQQLGRMARRVASQVSGYLSAPSFTAQFDRDIVQQTLVRLLIKGGFDAARGTTSAYLYPVMRDAARDVFREYGIPFKRSRSGGGMQIQGTLVMSVAAHATTVSESIADADDDFAVKDGELEAGRLIATAPESAQAALRFMAFEDAPLGHAAAQTGQSRYALRRKIDSWVGGPAFQVAS